MRDIIWGNFFRNMGKKKYINPDFIKLYEEYEIKYFCCKKNFMTTVENINFYLDNYYEIDTEKIV